MNRSQKIALTFVVTITASLLLTAVAAIIIYIKFGPQKTAAALGFLGLIGFAGLTPLLIKKDKGKITFDERDSHIQKTAASAGFAFSYLFTGLSCMLPFIILGRKAVIPVTWLPMIFAGAGIIFYFISSLTTLILYRKGGPNE